MFREPVVFVDIETTGGSYRNNRILELAAIKVVGSEVVDTWRSFINPGIAVPAFITGLTGITNDDVAEAPYFEDIAAELFAFMEGCTFVAHNVMFDFSFIHNQFKFLGYDFSPRRLCTLRLSRTLYPSERGHSLEKLIARHGIATKARHRAYDDALSTLEFCKIAAAEHGRDVFYEAVTKQLKSQNTPLHLNKQDIDDLPSSPGVYIFEDEHGRPLYIGKSIDIKKRVRSHFSAAKHTQKELKLAQQVHAISTHQTPTELEALLLESKLIKEQLPVYNRLLRRKRTQIILRKLTREDGYTAISLHEAAESELGSIDDIYGIYTSVKKAQETLEEHMAVYGLCPKLVGLEKSSRYCFNYQLGRCQGACGGVEPAATYNKRVEAAFAQSRIADWPYGAPVLVRTGSDDSGLIVYKWCVLGKSDEVDGYSRIDYSPRMFDVDTYKILKRFFTTNPLAFSRLQLQVNEQIA